MRNGITQSPNIRSAGAGALAGLIASVVQVTVGLGIDKLLLPRQHNNNIAPRLITRVFQRTGERENPPRDWLLGTLFHFSYGVTWGAAFGLVRRWTRIPAPLVSVAMGLLIYVLAFSEIGAGTKTGTEVHPRHRDPRKQLSLIAIVTTFVLTTTGAYERLTARSEAP